MGWHIPLEIDNPILRTSLGAARRRCSGGLTSSATGRTPKPGFVEDRTIADFPGLVSEWHPERNGSLHASALKAGSHAKVWWRCPGCPFCGERHEWQASCVNRTVNGTGCPYCSRRGSGKTCICTSVARHPVLASEFDPELNRPLCAEHISFASNRVVFWRCLADRSHPPYKARVKQRSGRNPSGCPLCAKEIPRIGHWHASIQEEFPSVAEEWDDTKNPGLSAEDVQAGSTLKAAWKCSSCGHEWVAAVKDRTLKGTGCPACADSRSQVEEAASDAGI